VHIKIIYLCDKFFFCSKKRLKNTFFTLPVRFQKYFVALDQYHMCFHFMIPKKSKYAIQALKCLAKVYPDQGKLSIAHIATEENISRKFLEAILLQLRHNGIVGSKMGPNGGYYLLQSPDEIVLSNIIRSTGGPIALLPCVSLNFYEPCEDCPHEELCGLHDVLLEVREASVRILSKTSLSDLIAREKKLAKKIKKQ